MSITAAAALQTVTDTLTLLNVVRERAQCSRDADLKGHINALYDSVLSVKEAVLRLQEENAELIKKQEQPKPELRQVGAVNYYFVGEQGPYCQPCYNRTRGELIPVSPRRKRSGEGVYRQCSTCGKCFDEKPADAQW